MKPGIQPEPERLIEVKGCDWSDFTCVGKFVTYKPASPKKLKGKSRFFIRMPDGTFEVAKDTWKDAESWEYVNETI